MPFHKDLKKKSLATKRGHVQISQIYFVCIYVIYTKLIHMGRTQCMQIREINAWNFHYNSASKISRPSSQRERVSSSFSPSPRSFFNELCGEHPYYLVFPRRPPWKMTGKAPGKSIELQPAKMAPTKKHPLSPMHAPFLLFIFAISSLCYVVYSGGKKKQWEGNKNNRKLDLTKRWGLLSGVYNQN